MAFLNLDLDSGTGIILYSRIARIIFNIRAILSIHLHVYIAFDK